MTEIALLNACVNYFQNFDINLEEKWECMSLLQTLYLTLNERFIESYQNSGEDDVNDEEHINGDEEKMSERKPAYWLVYNVSCYINGNWQLIGEIVTTKNDKIGTDFQGSVHDELR